MKIEEAESLQADLSTWALKISDMLYLRDGWNSYSAPAPNGEAIVNAHKFLNDAAIAPVRVAPSAVGGVGITYRNGDRKVYVEFFNAGGAHGLFADDLKQETHTLPVDLECPGLFVEKIGDYIHG